MNTNNKPRKKFTQNSRVLFFRVMEFSRFAAVGIITALIFIALVFLSEKLELISPLSTAVAYGTAIAFQYIAHAKFTFRRQAAHASQIRRFLLITMIGLGFSVFMLDILAPIVGWSRAIVSFFVVAILPILNYAGFKFWAFTGKGDDPESYFKEHAVSSHIYDDTFFTYIEQGSFRSAKRIAPIVVQALKPDSLLDVGCGRGAWASVWGEAGVKSVDGVDGDYVNIQKLHIDRARFWKHDLALPFDLGRRFDLVTTLEVAEHLPPASSAGFVDSLIRHSDMVLFSAATPGQGGERHVNERPLEFWRGLFAERGYHAFDFLRPKIYDDSQIEPWYRYNSILYVRAEAVSRLPEAVRASEVAPGNAFHDYAPAGWRLRRAIVRLLPRPVVDWIAVENARRKAKAASSP